MNEWLKGFKEESSYIFPFIEQYSIPNARLVLFAFCILIIAFPFLSGEDQGGASLAFIIGGGTVVVLFREAKRKIVMFSLNQFYKNKETQEYFSRQYEYLTNLNHKKIAQANRKVLGFTDIIKDLVYYIVFILPIVFLLSWWVVVPEELDIGPRILFLGIEFTRIIFLFFFLFFVMIIMFNIILNVKYLFRVSLLKKQIETEDLSLDELIYKEGIKSDVLP